MSHKFCKACNNLLYSLTTNTDLLFICESCGEEYKATDSDTLRLKIEKKTNFELYEKIIRNLKNDPAALIVQKKCSVCKHGFAKKARLGENKKIVFACIGKKCSNIWSN